ncbi:MAG: hypothetical protein JOZ37_14380 [Actinobacteria bacterium]|nr:hypothetical protein [Actinomycetota bacterium]MBV8959225.1 hypothetical protein [Actinomycetota bacterium]MBV9256187.1 hypothetical protein [Actinomycetota bacterium]MBV9665150.1 hypothetical protein [Actinomycetota bacterium]MBV9933115.1 hypothetical protein [Actinomycetota bacterium]
MKHSRADIIRLLEEAGAREVPKPSTRFVNSLERKLRDKPFAKRPVARGPAQDQQSTVTVPRGPRVPAWPAVAAGLLLVAAVVVFSTRSNKGIVSFITGERAAPTTTTTREPLPPTTVPAPTPGVVLTVPTTVVVAPSTTTSTTVEVPTTVGVPPRVTTTTAAVPQPTMRLTVTPGAPGHFSLQWEKYSGPVFDQYVVLRAYAPDKPHYPAGPETTVLGTIRTQSQTAWDDAPPTDKGNLYYMVVAVSQEGHELGRSTTAQGTIKAS